MVTLKAPMTTATRQKKTVGEIIGKTTKKLDAVAPSIVAPD